MSGNPTKNENNLDGNPKRQNDDLEAERSYQSFYTAEEKSDGNTGAMNLSGLSLVARDLDEQSLLDRQRDHKKQYYRIKGDHSFLFGSPR